MTMTTKSIFLIGIVALSGVACEPMGVEQGAPIPVQRPKGKLNVVFVLSDALRAANLPQHGYDRDTAPGIGRWMSQGVLFENHYANSSLTPVSVSQMFSSRLKGPLLMDAQYRLAPVRAITDDLFVLPQFLKEEGYLTGIVSSHAWFNHNARVMKHFDVQKRVKPLKSVYWKDGAKKTRDLESYASFKRLWAPVRDLLVDAASQDGPFFLYVHSMDTHAPFRCHRRFDRFCRVRKWYRAYNRYDSEIEYTDFWVQSVKRQLDMMGLGERTIFVFTSDHGEEFNEMGKGPTNRNHGYTARRALVHVPLAMILPGNPTPGRVYKGLTQHLDVGPTLASLAVPDANLNRFDDKLRVGTKLRVHVPQCTAFVFPQLGVVAYKARHRRRGGTAEHLKHGNNQNNNTKRPSPTPEILCMHPVGLPVSALTRIHHAVSYLPTIVRTSRLPCTSGVAS